MSRRIGRLILWLVLLLLVVAAGGLLSAHLAIRRERAALPTPRALVDASVPDDGPVRVGYLNTARQSMSRSRVLEAELDPTPQAPYVMGHPSIVLQWADGRLLLVDLGMTRAGALAFGKPMQWLGAAPMEALGSVAEQLGAARARVGGVLFTHLHTDHTGGIAELCAGGPPLRVFMTEAQALRPNYTTRPGLRLVESAPCAQIVQLHADRGPALAVPGFPGVMVLAAGGHTPGSQIIVATVAGPSGLVRFAFAGDIANAFDGVRLDIPKPRLYSLLLVPEDRLRLAELRAFLRALGDLGVRVVVAHDLRALEASGIQVFAP